MHQFWLSLVVNENLSRLSQQPSPSRLPGISENSCFCQFFLNFIGRNSLIGKIPKKLSHCRKSIQTRCDNTLAVILKYQNMEVLCGRVLRKSLKGRWTAEPISPIQRSFSSNNIGSDEHNLTELHLISRIFFETFLIKKYGKFLGTCLWSYFLKESEQDEGAFNQRVHRPRRTKRWKRRRLNEINDPQVLAYMSVWNWLRQSDRMLIQQSAAEP